MQIREAKRKGLQMKAMNINDGVHAFRETSGAVLLDVRPEEALKMGWIEGSINVPADDLQEFVALVPDAATPVFVYCTAGVMSAYAANILEKMGYLDVTNIGGIVDFRGELVSE